MPFYKSACSECGATHEFLAKVAARNRTPRCCGKRTSRVIEAPQVAAFSTATGWKNIQVGGRKFYSGDEANRYIKRNDLVPKHEGDTVARQVRRDRKKKDEQALDSAVTSAIQQHLG